KLAQHEKIFDLLFIDEVPKSESGKILRRVLREALMCELIDDQGDYFIVSRKRDWIKYNSKNHIQLGNGVSKVVHDKYNYK
ncbi:10272_t:CDS:2, partial [Cetraspora pellucida]